MNASAIYSKSGKGVQEASGKTSHLSRSDRAVLSAIDGRATLADVAQKVGKPFDPAFLKLIESLDSAGFIRQVSAGSPGGATPGAAAKPAAKPAPTPIDPASDLDFTTALSIPKAKRTAPPATPAPAPTAQEKALAEHAAKEQQDAFQKAREEAERKAAAERERVKLEVEAKARAAAEAKARTEAEARLKAEAEAKAKAEAEAKVKAAQEAAERAAAEAKAKAEAEAKKAREEAERARREAAEAAERARKEAEDKLRREQEELRRKLEEERKAREEAERRVQEEAKRVEEERRKLEEERRRLEEERAERARREQEEMMQAARAAAAKRQARSEAKREAEAEEPERLAEPAPAPASPASGAFSDSLLADLESFSTRDDEERKQKEEELRKEREAAVALAREVQERRAREEAERKTREDKERRKAEEAERKAREEAELREREERERQRLQEEEERRRAEAEERARKAKEEEQLAATALRQQAYDAEMRAKRERDLKKARTRRTPAAARAARRGWGKPVALTLFLLIVVGVAALHVLPIDPTEYERAASAALGRPVQARSANLSLLTGGLSIDFRDVSLGEGVRVPVVRAYPELDALLGPSKRFSRIELEGLKVEQEALGRLFFSRLDAQDFGIGRFVVKNADLSGPLALPKGLELEVVYADDGSVRGVLVRGPEGLNARLTRKGQNFDMDVSAASFTLPFAPEIMLSRFTMKGAATPQALTVSEWDGALLNGTLSGTASVRWGDDWAVDGIVTARNINAAVFAPALLSDGRGEGSGKFSMRGAPGKLAATSRLDGTFTVTRGVLGSIDLSRAIQTQGKSATGRTQFNEMNGQATYDRGTVSLRNVTIGAGQLNAGASADISQNGALSGRIVADVRVASQTLRATLNLGGTVKEPQVRN